MENKPLHNRYGRLQCATIEKNTPYGTGNGYFSAQIEKRNTEYLGRLDNVKKVQNHKYHVREEHRKEMVVEKSKTCNEDRN